MKKLWLSIPILMLLAITWTAADSEILPSDGSASVQQEKPGAWLGVMIKSTVKKMKEGEKVTEEKGVFVEDVVDDSPAEKAGIKEGDQLLAFNNVALGEASDLTDALKKLKEGDKATVTVMRDGKKMDMDVVLGAGKDRKVMISKSIRTPRAPRAPRAPMAGLAPMLSWVTEGGSGSYGMKIETLDKQLGEYFGAPEGQGVLVKSVKKDSDAEKAGFKAGDVIMRAGKKTVEDVGDFRSVLGAFDAGEKIPVKILRKGKDMTIELTAKEEEEEGHNIFMRKLDSGSSPRMFHFKSDGEDMDDEAEWDGLDSDQFDVRVDVDADEIEEGMRQMRIILNGKELDLENLKDVLEDHMEELRDNLEELREDIDVQVDDNKVMIRTKKI
ncbi:MAG: PDZ domain-containing protein [Bacteroidetes bacterium]|nr:PDZ domain-containing protein [Bacteroidota bacterium]